MRLRHLLPPAAAAAGAFLLLAEPVAAEEINGTADGEFLPGTPDDDVINGNGGDDDVFGDAGDDTITTGDGNDYIDGEDGDDTIVAGAGDDGVSGGEGDDTIDGGAGDDVLVGDGEVCFFEGSEEGDEGGFSPCSGASEDYTQPGDDVIDGGDGNDLIIGDGGVCRVEPDSQVPEETPNKAAAVVAAATGDDTETTCDDGDDVLNGGAGDDIIIGDGSLPDDYCGVGVAGAVEGGSQLPIPIGFGDCFPGGDDVIDGGEGNDWVEGDGGDDVVAGGDGSDLVFGDGFLGFLVGLGFNPGQLQEGFGLGEEIDRLVELLTLWQDGEIDEEDYEELYLTLYTFFQLGYLQGGGNDTVCGGFLVGDGDCRPDGKPDILIGGSGHDAVCGDEADPLVLGGEGSDVPCPIVEGDISALSGSATGSLAEGLRPLDDEFLEVDENGEANPWEFVVLNATLLSRNGDLATYKTAKGTIVIDVRTGEYTYTADAGATGSDTIEYAIQRRIVECPNYDDIEVTFLDEEEGFGLPSPCDVRLVRALTTAAVVVVDGEGVDEFIRSITKVINFILGEAVAVPETPAVGGEVKTPAAAPAELARTGADPLALALTGLGLVALGAVAQASSRRRRLGFALR